MNITRSVTIDAAPSCVVEFVGDARNLPVWAPRFAQAVRRDGARWIVESGGAQLPLDVRVAHESGTVDFLAANTPPGVVIGAFSRVVPNGDGSEYLFTRFVGAELTAGDVAREEEVIAQELQAVRMHCESARPV